MPDSKSVIEAEVNKVAGAIRHLTEIATTHRAAVTRNTAPKIANYLRILVNNLAEDLERLAEANVPPPGEFTLDADIPTVTQAIPTGVMKREITPEGRLVGQRKPAARPDEDDVAFIDD